MKRSERTTLDTVAIDPVLYPVLRWINSTVASGSCVKLNAMGIWKMNERIQELLIQCQHESIDGPEYPRWTDLEKFAELIVRECANVALEQKKWVEDMKAHNLHDEIWNLARIQQSQHIVEKIKEHFGVEE